MINTDQPGRIVAIVLLAPYLLRLGTKYEDTSLKLLALGFVVYELFWVLCSKCVCTLQS